MSEKPPRPKPISAVEKTPTENAGRSIDLQRSKPIEFSDPEQVPDNEEGPTKLRSVIERIELRRKWNMLRSRVVDSVPEEPKKLFTPADLAEQISKRKKEDSEVLKRREARAEKFAEQYGLSEMRQAMLDAEQKAYLEEKNKYQSLRGRLSPSARKERSEARQLADEATLAWNKALANLPEDKVQAIAEKKIKTLDPERIGMLTFALRDKWEDRNRKHRENGEPLEDEPISIIEWQKQQIRNEALIIRKRDTIIRANESRTQARLDGLDERGKTLVGKVINAPLATAKLGLRGMSATSEGIGKGLFKMFGDKSLTEYELEKQQAKYRRAGQIITGATLGTLIGIAAAPGTVAAAGGAAAYAGYLGVRSLVSGYLGVVGSRAAGLINKRFDQSKRQTYRSEVRTKINDEASMKAQLEALKAQQKAGAKGSYEARQAFDRNVRVAGAIAGGGLTSFGIGYELHHLQSVQNALGMQAHATEVHGHIPETAHSTAPASTPEAHMEIGSSDEGVSINNSSRLFGHFGHMLEKSFATTPHPNTPAIDAYLKLLHEHAAGSKDTFAHGEANLAKAFGFQGEHGLSEIMHKGDVIKLNAQHQVVIEWADHTRPPHVLINADGKINPDAGDLREHMGHVRADHHSHTHHSTHNPVPAEETPESTPGVRSHTGGTLQENTTDGVRSHTGGTLQGGAIDATNSGPQELVNYDNQIAFHNAITAEHRGLLAQKEQLDSMYKYRNPEYAAQLEAYNQNLETYKEHLNSYYAQYNSGHPLNYDAANTSQIDAPPPVDSIPPPVAVHETPIPLPVEHTMQAPPVEAVVSNNLEHIITNHLGLKIDEARPHIYADSKGNLIAYGGTLNERAQAAADYINKDHSAVIYFDASTPRLDGGTAYHLSQAKWDPTMQSVIAPNEVMDSSLRGHSIPTAEDLARQIDT